MTDETLASWTVAFYHFMGPEMILVGRWTQTKREPFAYRCAFSINEWQAAALNPIDRFGIEWGSDAAITPEINAKMRNALSQWMFVRRRADRYQFSLVPRIHFLRIAELFGLGWI